MRRELGGAARELLRGRRYRRLGFVRLSDYASERLGISARTLQSAAWLATRLDELPAVSSAFDRSEISWSQARLICTVASAGDESHWLALAARSSADTLERLARRARPAKGVPANPEPDDDEIDGEPAVRWSFACPTRIRALWRRAVELASRMAGGQLSTWQAAEVIAAEGFSGRPSGLPIGERVLATAVGLADRPRRLRHRADDDGDPAITPPSADASPECPGPTPIGSYSVDPFALDARLVEAMGVIQTVEPRIGRLLCALANTRMYRLFGYSTLDGYVRERLGISTRKAWALLKVEKATLRSDEFGRAYREGRLSWVRSLALLPVLDRENAAAWIARAEQVTHRRLCDEVGWVLEARDVLGPYSPLTPPPLDARLVSPVGERHDLSLSRRMQIGAHSEVSDATIRLAGPASLVALLRDVLDAFQRPGAPRWTALEHLLLHVITHWEAMPRHRDPIFARDGWRCTVPACSSRRNLHDHHIQFRSQGGDNARDNRTVVCAAHHLHGIHDGTIRASGSAPHAVAWQLGVRAGAPPLLSYVGDRRG